MSYETRPFFSVVKSLVKTLKENDYDRRSFYQTFKRRVTPFTEVDFLYVTIKL